jgi:hypothetical protein
MLFLNMNTTQVRGQEYRFLATEDGAKAHKLFWEGEKLHYEYLYPAEDFHALSTLSTLSG